MLNNFNENSTQNYICFLNVYHFICMSSKNENLFDAEVTDGLNYFLDMRA